MSNKSRESLKTREGAVKRDPFSPLTKRSSLFDEFLTPFDQVFDGMMKEFLPAFTDSRLGVDFFKSGSYPKVDIVDDSDHVIIHAAVPGMSKNDIEIEILDGVLSISGKSNQVEEYKDKYVHKEIKRSQFRRSFTLGDNLDQNSIDASFEDGLLTLKISKIEVEKDISPTKIEIK